MTFNFMAFVWITKESHMHDIKLYSSYFFPTELLLWKNADQAYWMIEWLTNLANWIQWTKLNQTNQNN